MVAYYNPLDAELDALLSICDVLYAFQNNGPIPVLLEKRDVVPAMAETWEDSLRPFRCGIVLVVFNLDTVL